MSDANARKLMNKAKEFMTKKENTPAHIGGVDMSVCSPKAGAWPWFVSFKKEQISKDGAFAVVKKILKDFKEGDKKWAFSFAAPNWYSVRVLPLRASPGVSPSRDSLMPCVCHADLQ